MVTRQIPINSVCVEEEIQESNEETCESVERIFLDQAEQKEFETINVMHLQSPKANSEQHKDKDIV
jgi:hypothetical protein